MVIRRLLAQARGCIALGIEVNQKRAAIRLGNTALLICYAHDSSHRRASARPRPRGRRPPLERGGIVAGPREALNGNRETHVPGAPSVSRETVAKGQSRDGRVKL